MKLRCRVDFDPNDILNRMGLGKSNKARQYLARRARDYMDPYVPYDTGRLKGSAKVENRGSQVIYSAPYARSQYYLPYHHPDPRRGRYWDRRMAANHGEALARELGAYLGGEKP